MPLKNVCDSSSAEADGGVGGVLEQKPTVAIIAAKQEGMLNTINWEENNQEEK